jgi:hypothetical protein
MKQNDLYVLMHDRENVGSKPVIVVIPAGEKQQYEAGDFNKLLEKILEKEDPEFSDTQLIHFRNIKKYRERVASDDRGVTSLCIWCYDEHQQEQKRVVDNQRALQTVIQSTDIIAPYVLRDMKTKANENYDRIEMVVAYDPCIS